jgi:hypothetical protein
MGLIVQIHVQHRGTDSRRDRRFLAYCAAVAKKEVVDIVSLVMVTHRGVSLH